MKSLLQPRGQNSPLFFQKYQTIIVCLFGLVLVSANAFSADQTYTSETESKARFLTEICSSKPKRMKVALQDIATFTVSKSDMDSVVARTRWGIEVIAGIQEKRFRCSKEDGQYLMIGDQYLDPISLEKIEVGGAKYKAPFLHLPVRPTIETVLTTSKILFKFLTSGIIDSKQLMLLEKKPEYINTEQINYFLNQELREDFRKRLVFIRAFKLLKSSNTDEVATAIQNLSGSPSRKTLTAISKVRKVMDPVQDSSLIRIADTAIADIRLSLKISKVMATLYSGLSYSSILFLASIGLAIVFGLMGVINLAQGELIMVGAYVTFIVQECLAAIFPPLLPLYLLISIPFVFVVTGGMGALIEYSVIRHLYTRPLMTLLATWGVSIFLINLIRVSFGTQNLEFYVPDYLVGGLSVFGDFLVTWNRLATIVFAALILIFTLFLVKKTKFGTNVRAVTENRSMAEAIGVNTRKVDCLSFAVGSGLAGLAGLGLSTIYNVNPNMGTNFIVDAFMVVVLGGVGSIWGTVFAALLVGMINVAVEPLYGAVAAKVLVMILIIAVIQIRPEGIFAMKVRR